MKLRKPPLYTKRELQRVGVATTLIAVLGTIVIIGMTIVLGHYNTLIHSGPKAVVDGMAIGLLIGMRGRWRLLALLGVVYGLVLLVQVGLLYLLPIMALAGVAAAAVGRGACTVNRTLAILLAAMTYEAIAGTGGAVRILFGTRGDEPLIWAMWGGEMACRITGAIIGVALSYRVLARSATPNFAITADAIFSDDAGGVRPPPHRRSDIRQRGVGSAALRMGALIAATVIPLSVSNTNVLIAITIAAGGYAWWAGLRKQLLGIATMFVCGWLMFSVLSIVWHHDPHRAVGLLRSLVLQFLPMTLCAAVLVETARSVDILRLFRSIGMGPVILLPLSHVVRQAPVFRRDWLMSLNRLRQSGTRLWFIKRPRYTARILIAEPFRKLAVQLIDA